MLFPPVIVTAQTPLVCGQLLNGAIAAGVTSQYSVTIAAGEVVRFVVMSDNWNWIELRDPSGGRVAEARDVLQLTISATGAYRLLVRAYNPAQTLNYSLTFQQLRNPCGAPDLACGQLTAGTLRVAEMHLRNLTIAAGEVVRFVVMSDNWNWIELIDSNGVQIAQARDQLQTTAPSAGRYTLLVRAYNQQQMVNYSLTFQQLRNPCGAPGLTCGQLSQGTLRVSEMHLRNLTITAGEVVRFVVMSDNWNWIELFDFNGARIAEARDYLQTTVSGTGRYTLVVRAYNQQQTLNYTLTYQQLRNPCGASDLTCGQWSPGTLRVAEMHLWNLMIPAGEVVRFVTISNNWNWMELFDSNGVRIAEARDLLQTTVPGTGRYTLLVRAYNQQQTLNYTLSFQQLRNPCGAATLSCGQWLPGTLRVAEMRPFTLNVSPGEVVRFVIASDNWNWLELFDANGVKIAEARDELLTTLHGGGRYTLLVRAYNMAQTLSYSMSFQQMRNPCSAPALPCNQSITGSLRPAEMHLRTVNVPAGEPVRFTVTSNNWNWIELWDAAGIKFAEARDRLDTTITSGGRHTVAVRPYNFQQPLSYTLGFLQLRSPCLPFNQQPLFTNVIPHEGRGPSQVFTAIYDDPDGWTDLSKITLNFHEGPNRPDNACSAEFDVATSQVRLRTDAGNAWLGPVTAGPGSPSLQNAACIINSSAATRSGSGTTLTLNLPVTFKPAFTSGRPPKKQVCGSATDVSAAGGLSLCLGVWDPTLDIPAPVSLYRLFHPGVRRHLYTTDAFEYSVLPGNGWSQEGALGRIYIQPAAVGGIQTTPFYRMYFMPDQRHFWTADRNEYDYWIRTRPDSWLGEGVDSFILPAMSPGMIPFYRLLWTGTRSAWHLFTTDKNERDFLCDVQKSWICEPVAGYLFPAAAADEVTGEAEMQGMSSPQITAVLSAASFENGPVAPGQVVRVYARSFTRMVQMLVDGVPVELQYIGREYIELRVPETVGDLARFEIQDINGTSEPVEIPVVAARPGVFVEAPLGRGLAVMLPSEPGTLAIQVTGLGSESRITANIGGLPAEVLSVRVAEDQPGRHVITLRPAAEVLAAENDSAQVLITAGEAQTQFGTAVRLRRPDDVR
jgi:plastocyanin